MTIVVLLVEDNELNLELARDLLELEGHQVNVAKSGAAFRERLSSDAVPDIVLMDILLPDADGVKLLGELRAKTSHAGLPVIALTAQAIAGDAETFLAAGFDAVMTKPIDTRTFASEVERWAHARGARTAG